jgi:CheY-like chemotaxis protein
MDAALDLEHHRHIVLVVGDAGDVLVETLLRAGFDAIAVVSGRATLALLESGSEPCALVIDADAPAAQAWSLWDRVRARGEAKRPAAVLLSAKWLDASRARAAGIHEVVRKPVEAERLIAALERHCPRRLWPKFTPAAARSS